VTPHLVAAPDGLPRGPVRFLGLPWSPRSCLFRPYLPLDANGDPIAEATFGVPETAARK